jgi:DNA-binding NarL/FixJ family response regulator
MSESSAGGAARVIRVLVADDQAIIRDGLVTVLSLLPDVEVVGEAANGEEAVRLVAETDPDVVLMDLRMPVLDGAAASERITRDSPRTAILILTTFADDESIMSALRAGARGYLTKDAGRVEVASAVRAVAQGQSTFAPEVGALLVSSLTGSRSESVDARFSALTQREGEVLALVADGLNNREIAAALFVSVATVKTHINSIFAKLGVRDRAQAITLVRR